MNRVKIGGFIMAILIAFILLSGCRPPEIEGTVISIKNERLDEAFNLAEEAITKYPENGEAWYYWGYLNAKHKKNYSVMNEAFEKALTLSPAVKVRVDEGTATVADAVNQIRTNTFGEHYNAAAKLLTKASETEDDAARLKLYGSAQEKLQLATDVDPGRVEPIRPLALTHLSLGDTTKALKILEEGIARFPQNEDMVIAAGEVYQRTNDQDKAIAMFNKALELNPENSDIYQKLGVIESNRQNWDKANEYYSRALDINPDDANLAFNIGVSFYNQNKFEQAVDFFQRSVVSDPDNEVNHAILAQCLVRAEKYDDALAHLEEAVQMFPENADMWELLAITYGQKKMSEKSDEAFKKSKSLRGE